VDGAIHRRGGPTIVKECKVIVKEKGSLPPGNAVITHGGNLPATYVIHTVGPIWRGGKGGEAETLRNAYNNSLELAETMGLTSVAFPSISTGAYGYPVEEAVNVALQAAKDFLMTSKKHGSVERVIFVLFDNSTLSVYERTLSEL